LYRLSDGGTEQFRCAPGPMGWRYFSTVQDTRGTTNVDLSVDASWRPVRVRIQTPEHHLLLSARGSILDDEQPDVTFEPGSQTVDFPSPCFPLATARRLGGSGEIDVVSLDPGTLQPSTERHRFDAGADEEIATPIGRFVARAYRHIAPRAHSSRALWIAGDVVVAGGGLELAAYDPGGRGPRPLS
jgi:hypothetical protein